MKITRIEDDNATHRTSVIGKKIINKTNTAILIATVFLATGILANINNKKNNTSTAVIVPSASPAPVPTATINPNKAQQNLDYSSAETFYNEILNYRKQYNNDFANKITSVDDVINLINWLELSNLNYYISDENLNNVPNLKTVEDQLDSYFVDCQKHNIKTNIASICNNYPEIKNSVAMTESLIADLTANNNYADENKVFEDYLQNVIIQTGAFDFSKDRDASYAILTYRLYIANRQTADMAKAIYYEKNDVLNVTNPTTNNYDNNITCPQGVDDLIIGNSAGDQTFYAYVEEKIINTEKQILGR